MSCVLAVRVCRRCHVCVRVAGVVNRTVVSEGDAISRAGRGSPLHPLGGEILTVPGQSLYRNPSLIPSPSVSSSFQHPSAPNPRILRLHLLVSWFPLCSPPFSASCSSSWSSST